MAKEPVLTQQKPAAVHERHRIITHNWSWFLALGIGLAVLGFVAIALPIIATFTVALLVGWILVGAGIMHVIHAFRSSRWGGLALGIASGLLYIVVGLITMALPLGGVISLTIILAAFFIVEGVLKILRALRLRGLPNWGWSLFSGIVSVILGLVIWALLPGSALWVLGTIVGIEVLFSGLAMLAIGIAGRKALHGGAVHCVGAECFSRS